MLGNEITIYLSTLTGKRLELKVGDTDTAESFHEAVEKELSIDDKPSDFKISPNEKSSHMLFFCGKQIYKSKDITLKDYNIYNECTIVQGMRCGNRKVSVKCFTKDIKFKVLVYPDGNVKDFQDMLTQIVGLKCTSISVKRTKEKRLSGPDGPYQLLNEEDSLPSADLYATFEGALSNDNLYFKLNDYQSIEHAAYDIRAIDKSEERKEFDIFQYVKPSKKIVYTEVPIKIPAKPSPRTFLNNGAALGGCVGFCACLALIHRFPKHSNYILLTEAVAITVVAAVLGSIIVYGLELFNNYLNQPPERQNDHQRN